MMESVSIQNSDMTDSPVRNLTENVSIMIALAASEPDSQEGRIRLDEIYTSLTEREKACEELLSAIQASKKRTLKEINNRVIDGQSLTTIR